MDMTNMTEDEIIKLAAKLNGQRHGAKGGKAAWRDKSPEERSSAMRALATARWAKVRQERAKDGSAS